MQLKVYSYSGCGTCRKALKFLADHGVEYGTIPIRERPPSKAVLRRLLKARDGELRRLFNTSGQDYRRLQLKDQLPTMSTEEALSLLVNNGNLIKRPVAVAGDDVWSGFDEAEWRERLSIGA